MGSTGSLGGWGPLFTSPSISGKENVTDCVILADGRGSCTPPGCVAHQPGGQKLLSQEKPLSHDFPSYGEVVQQEDVPRPCGWVSSTAGQDVQPSAPPVLLGDTETCAGCHQAKHPPCSLRGASLPC